MRAGLYIRVSTEHQAKEGYSVSAQKDSLKKFANAQSWKIVDVYADEGISGKNIEDRPAVKKLINDIEQKKIDVVALYKFDRLTRDSRDTENIIELIQKYNIQVFTLSGGTIDVTTATGRFAVRINGAVAQLEREQTIERVKFALKQKVQQGYSLASNTTCYGYNRKKHEKELIINKEEANIVKQIFKMYLNGKTYTEICNFLNSRNIPTKLSKKKENKVIWMPKTVRLILTNETYIGKVRYHIGRNDAFVVDGKHEPIISKTIWDEVQLMVLKRKKISKTCIPKEDVYYAGTLFCGICGQKLTTNRTTRIKKDGSRVSFNGYRCVNHEKGLCNNLGMSHKKVEKVFLEFLEKIEELQSFDDYKNCEEFEIEDNVSVLYKNIYKFNNKKKEIMRLFTNNDINYEQFNYMINIIDKKINELNKKVNEVNSLNKNTFYDNNISKNIKDHWYFLTNKEKFLFLTNFVKKIEIVNRDKDKVNGRPEIIDVKFYEE